MGGPTLERFDLIAPWIKSVGFRKEFVPAIQIVMNLTSTCSKPIRNKALNRLACSFCGVHSLYDAQV
jgi:hypothetical protein